MLSLDLVKNFDVKSLEHYLNSSSEPNQTCSNSACLTRGEVVKNPPALFVPCRAGKLTNPKAMLAKLCEQIAFVQLDHRAVSNEIGGCRRDKGIGHHAASVSH